MRINTIVNIHIISDENVFFTINDQLFLEKLLFEIKDKAIVYSSYQKKLRKQEKENRTVLLGLRPLAWLKK